MLVTVDHDLGDGVVFEKRANGREEILDAGLEYGFPGHLLFRVRRSAGKRPNGRRCILLRRGIDVKPLGRICKKRLIPRWEETRYDGAGLFLGQPR